MHLASCTHILVDHRRRVLHFNIGHFIYILWQIIETFLLRVNICQYMYNLLKTIETVQGCQIDTARSVYYNIGDSKQVAFSFDGSNVVGTYTSHDAARYDIILLRVLHFYFKAK